MASQMVNIALRGWQFLCTILVMSLIGNMIATSIHGDASIVNYDMFVAVFALLSLLYLLPTTFLDSYSVPVVNLALDVLNVLFWFCAAVATAAYLGVHSCSNSDYTRSNSITNSSPDTEKRCREAQASTAFLWFGWLAFVASLVLSILGGTGTANLRGGVRGLGGGMGGVRRGGPAMSQV